MMDCETAASPRCYGATELSMKSEVTMNVAMTTNDIMTDPHGYAAQWKQAASRPVVGYFCSYTPEEIIHAAGALPFRIFGAGDTFTRADAHLQAYSCSLVRGGLEDALQGRLNFLDATVFPHTCDSIQRLSDIWRLNSGIALHYDVILPVKLNTESAREYMVQVIRKFRKDLEKGLGITISDAALAKSVALYNDIRGTFMEIYRLRSQHPGIVPGRKILEMIKCSMVMDRDDFLSTLKAFHEEMKALADKGKKKPAKRILLAGGICNHPDFYTIIEESGGAVVYDDLCTGSRLYEGSIEASNDPVKAIAERYIQRIVCPAKHSDITSRGENLARLAKEHGAQGVIFLFLKFCDPQSFDYPYLKEYMDGAGIPSMVMEVEERLPSEGQLRTRFETFISML